MKFGVNTFVWVSPSSTQVVQDLAPKVKSMGFEILEISVENPELLDAKRVAQSLNENRLDGIICGVFGLDRNISSDDSETRENAKRYIRWLVDAADEIGSEVVCGPMYSAVGKEHLENRDARKAEWQRAIDGLGEVGRYAAGKNIKLALEPLNRFENDMINIVAQGVALIDEIGLDNIGFHLDTFHMHLEEKNSADAIRQAGKRIFHFHACENDRGVPGSGQVHWQAIAQALRDVHYLGPIVIESFTPQLKEIARAVCIWREIAPSQDAIAIQGLQFLRRLLA